MQSRQFVQFAQRVVQGGELVAVVVVDQLGELGQLVAVGVVQQVVVVKLVGVLVADNRAHVLPAWCAGLAGHWQTSHLHGHSASHSMPALPGAALVLCPLRSLFAGHPCGPVVRWCGRWSCCDLGKAGFIDAEVPFNL